MGIPECPEPGASRNAGGGGGPVFPSHSRQARPWSSDGSSGHRTAVGGVTPSQRDEAFPADGGRGLGLLHASRNSYVLLSRGLHFLPS